MSIWRREQHSGLPSGENLIFLVSQPRSGSTLVQRTLARHSEIHTTSEPWLLLHPLRALDRKAFTARHDARVAHTALTDFLAGLADGIDAYYAAVAQFAGHLYQAALEGTEARYFLDKTPRYYLILDEIAKVFPHARFLLLARNPAAVIASIYATWVKGDPARMRRYAADLLDAPGALLEARASLGSGALWLRYEDFVAQPDTEIPRILQFLDLGPIGEASDEPPHFALGDQETVYQHQEPQADYGNRWQDDLADPQLARWIGEYAGILGADTISALGYRPEEIDEIMATHQPARARGTVSLAAALRRR